MTSLVKLIFKPLCFPMFYRKNVYIFICRKRRKTFEKSESFCFLFFFDIVKKKESRGKETTFFLFLFGFCFFCLFVQIFSRSISAISGLKNWKRKVQRFVLFRNDLSFYLNFNCSSRCFFFIFIFFDCRFVFDCCRYHFRFNVTRR